MLASPTEKLKLAVEGTTAILTIDNPAANVWDEESLSGLEAIMAQLNADREIFALVIHGAGEKFFSAGADLNVFADGDRARARSMALHFGRAFEALSAFRGVSIAAINGYAMGGGLECALACDLRIAEQHAQLALPEATVGLLPCGGGTQNLAWVVGEGWAKRMILCGERVNAETAERIGLVEAVVEKGEALATAKAWAANVGRQSPVAVTACKGLIMRARKGPMAESYAHEREAFVDLFSTADQREGVNAFLEKRAPVWENA
ncbi:MAG: enoyl-CoA hydratase [Pseudomonadales bacterium]|jgi:enoyl-CoA hydratase/carnithine racemase|nr:enoyl-CoA hydratase [Pseudomonadales bacterium]MBL6808298.1 enoyl-CoA hydratase [Pseudomonadales bacterium]